MSAQKDEGNFVMEIDIFSFIAFWLDIMSANLESTMRHS